MTTSQTLEPPKTRVLVVDDEPSIVDAVGTALRYEGFDVSTASSGRDALKKVTADEPDFIVLDVMLPDLDGFEVTRRLRAEGTVTPVLFLTAKDATEDKVVGLNVGGDDYLTKPFSLAELIARTRAILRRAGAEEEQRAVLRFADVVLDQQTYEVTRNGELVQLTSTEFNLLRYLMLNSRRVLSKSEILANVWHYDFGGDGNNVETYISYLRRKLDAHGPPLIQTVRGVGYRLRIGER
jgi:two-component system OmpR family response regulator